MQNNSGFTLVEVLVAAGIASVIALGTMAMMTNSMKATRSVGLSGDFNALASNIRMLLNDESLCTAALGDLAYPTGSSKVTSVPQLSANGANFAKLGATVGGLKTTQLELEGQAFDPAKTPVVSIGSGFLYKLGATLRFTAEKQGESLGGKFLHKDFHLTVLTEPGTNKIRQCYGEVSKAEILSELRTVLKAEICSELGGGFDLSSGRCTAVRAENLVQGNEQPGDGASQAIEMMKKLQAQAQAQLGQPPAEAGATADRQPAGANKELPDARNMFQQQMHKLHSFQQELQQQKREMENSQ